MENKINSIIKNWETLKAKGFECRYGNLRFWLENQSEHIIDIIYKNI